MCNPAERGDLNNRSDDLAYFILFSPQKKIIDSFGVMRGLRYILLFFFLQFFNPLEIFSQKFKLSNNLDKLVLDSTTIKQAIKILGKPTKKRLDKQWGELTYDSLNTTLRFDPKLKVLFSIEIHKPSKVLLGGKSYFLKSDTMDIINVFGNNYGRIHAYDMFAYNYFDYDNKGSEVSFNFDDIGLVTLIMYISKKYIEEPFIVR
jgi:hypothetical protein